MEEQKIIELYWNRDESALTETDRKYGMYCRSIAWNILHSQEDSEECVNDTYLRAWNTIPPQRPARLNMYLAKITRNLAFDRYKAQMAQKRGGSEITVILDELAECVAGGESVEDAFLAKELAEAIGSFVRGLSEREANVFVRRYFFAETAKQIGTRYSLSANNVTVILSRTRQKLKEYLKKEGYLL